MKKDGLEFLVRIFLISFVVFGVHLLMLSYFSRPLFDAMIVKAYITNILLASVIYFLLYFFRNRYRNQLGFLFLLGSFIKFLAFFLFFNHIYKQDSLITNQEFFAFFIPYTTTLIVEVFSLSKWMNKLEQ